MPELEGFMEIDDEVEKCSMKGCKNKVVMSTVVAKKKKGLKFDEYHFWCQEHYREITAKTGDQDGKD